MWNHGEEKLLEFIEILNSAHPSIKFTCGYSRKSINFLDVQVILEDGKFRTDLYVKPTDTHQYLDASSCHVFHSKRSIPYSQALCLNRICSDQKDFDKRCNELEGWLLKRGYSEKLVREQVLKGRKFDRNELLERGPKEKKPIPLTLNIVYHPAFSKLKSILEKIHLLLTPNAEHQRVFSEVPIVGFRKGKSLKDLLVRAKVPEVNKKAGTSEKCGSKKCQVCNWINVT